MTYPLKISICQQRYACMDSSGGVKVNWSGIRYLDGNCRDLVLISHRPLGVWHEVCLCRVGHTCVDRGPRDFHLVALPSMLPREI